MRVLHISKYDLKGGASRAAYASVVGQRRAGIHSEMLVGVKDSECEFVHAYAGLTRLAVLAGFVGEKVPALLTWNRTDVRSLHMFGLSARAIQQQFRPDIVIAHKIDGILPIRELPKFTVPVIWRLHDMWPICGTRHYEPDEQVLRSPPSEWPGRAMNRVLESAIYGHKEAVYERAKTLVICTPSRWLAECVRASPLFSRNQRIEVVANGIDTTVFRPRNRAAARQALGLPVDEPIVLFGAVGGARDPRKGFDLLLGALEVVGKQEDNKPRLLTFGEELLSEIGAIGLSATSVGRIENDKQLSELYSAADVFVAPSRQENLSLTVLESLACGTPVVAFRVGGMPDMIEHGRNGWLTKPFDVADLSEQICTALRVRDTERAAVTAFARQTVVSRFSMETEARSMMDLIRRILDRYEAYQTDQPAAV